MAADEAGVTPEPARDAGSACRGFVIIAPLVWWESRRGEPFLDVRMRGANRALTMTYVRYALTWPFRACHGRRPRSPRGGPAGFTAVP